jgi:spermidine/putrescine-binding protein
MAEYEWIVLVYKVPSEPSKYRATVWREIKRLGGVYLQNGVAIFPDIDDVSLNVSALALQIRSMDGTEHMFFTQSTTQNQSDELIRMFQDARTTEYNDIAPDIETIEERVRGVTSKEDIQEVFDELKKLKKNVGTIKGRDYFKCPKGQEVLSLMKDLQSTIQTLQREGVGD